MCWRGMRWLQRMWLLGTFCTAFGAAHATAQAPAWQPWLPDARLTGQGSMRFLGLRIYDARLWAGPALEAANFAQVPLALELTYHRAFTASAIAARSVQEIQRQGHWSPDTLQRWRAQLAQWLPDVQAGDRLTGVYLPGQGMRLWHGEQALGLLADQELAQHFFGIWLSPQTSEPALRRTLLQGQP